MRRPELVPLTSLRFFAAFGVVLHHLLSWGFLERDVYSLGGACVTFFFVLSGFILVYSYSDRFSQGSFSRSSRDFFRARFARIYPVYLVTLIASIPIILSVVARPGVELRREAMLHALMLQPYFPNPEMHFGFNGPAWSIGVEALFYAVFPFMVMALIRHRTAPIGTYARWACWLWLAAVAPIAVERLFRLDLPVNWLFYVFPPYRIFDFAIGVVIGGLYLQHGHELRRRLQGSRASLWESGLLATVLLSIILASKVEPLWMRPLDLILGPVVILTAALGLGWVSRVLCWSWLRYLGKLSFSLYMIHYVIMEVLVLKFHVDVEARYWPWIIIGMSLVASDLLYNLVEQPGRRLLMPRRRPQLPAAIAADTARA